MSHLARQTRGLLIALIVLLLSAGVVFGAHVLPAASTAGSTPAANGPSSAAGDEDAGETENADEQGPADPEPAEADSEAAPAAADPAAADPGGAHGAIVSQAAQMPTPAGFDNHGKWVSCVAHLTKLTVTPGAPALTLADITPAACAAADAAKQAAKDAKAAARAADRAARDAQHASKAKGPNK